MKVLVKSPDGHQHIHGFLDNQVFIRDINYSAIRRSDNSFCINPDCFSLLDSYDVISIRFALKCDKSLVVYEIPYNIVKGINPVCNEYMERNVRVPVECCKEVYSYIEPFNIPKEEVKAEQLSFI